jgi:hypothetical protein
MKVIHKMKNILIQEFQHYLESKLIEVAIDKMPPIQFVSNVNLIQIQSIQVVDVLYQRLSAPAIYRHQC